MATIPLTQAHPPFERNPGMPLDMSAVEGALVNRSAIER